MAAVKTRGLDMETTEVGKVEAMKMELRITKKAEPHLLNARLLWHYIQEPHVVDKEKADLSSQYRHHLQVLP